MQPEELTIGKLMNITEECGRDGKNYNVPQEMRLVTSFTSSEPLQIVPENECAKDKTLKADPNLKWSMTTHQVIKKNLTHVKQ